MVRTGGLSYACKANASAGSRISDLRLNGTPLISGKSYRVAGWASVTDMDAGGTPVWEPLGEYLKHARSVHIDSLNTPKLL